MLVGEQGCGCRIPVLVIGSQLTSTFPAVVLLLYPAVSSFFLVHTNLYKG